MGTDRGIVQCGDIIDGETSDTSYFDYYKFVVNTNLYYVQFTTCNSSYTDYWDGLSLWECDEKKYDLIIGDKYSSKCGSYGTDLTLYYSDFYFSEYSYCFVIRVFAQIVLISFVLACGVISMIELELFVYPVLGCLTCMYHCSLF